MNIDRHWLAGTLVGWCAALLPADRASWAAAMKAEVGAIEDGYAALSFAAGCVWGSVKERTFDINFVARSVRFATIVVMLVLALAAALLAERMIDINALSALVFGLTSALFVVAVVWSYLRGPMALVQSASSMIPLYIITYTFVAPHEGIVDAWIDVKLYQALAIEGIVIWAVLLIGGIFMLRVETLSVTTRT